MISLKHIPLCLFACFQLCFIKIYAANINDSTAKKTLATFMKENDCWECSKQLNIFKTADSLANLIPNNEKLILFKTSQPMLRYYIFLDILKNNEELAFTLLKESIDDSAKLCFFCCSFSEEPLNIQLFNHLYKYLYMKYYLGVSCTIDARSYFFKGHNKKLWKEKRERIKLIGKQSTNPESFNNISRSVDKKYK